MPKNPVVNFTFNGYQFRLEEYDYIPGIPGRYSGPPEHCFPDEPPELEPVKLLIEDFSDGNAEGYKEIPLRAVDLLLELREDLWSTMIDSVEDALRKEEPEHEQGDID